MYREGSDGKKPRSYRGFCFISWFLRRYVSVRPGSYLASVEAAICEAHGDYAHEPMVTMCVTAAAASLPATEASGRLDWSCVAAV